MSQKKVSELMALAVDEFRAGRHGPAMDSCRRVLDSDPDHGEAQRLLGIAAGALGDLDQAIRFLEQAILLMPDDEVSLSSLATALMDRERYADATKYLARLAVLRPNDGLVRFRHANALQRDGRIQAAIDSYQQALELIPNHAQAHNNLGNAWRTMGDRSQSLACYKQALALNPQLLQAHLNLANWLADDGQIEAAMVSCEKALMLDPEHPEAHLQKAHCHLIKGEYREGWEELEWRWKCKHMRGVYREYPVPLWTGETGSVHSVLLHTEQGAGDSFQFIRYVRLLTARGLGVVLQCPAELKKVLASADGLDTVITGDNLSPDVDAHCPLMSLPRVMHTDSGSIPAATPYLYPDAERVAHWRALLGSEEDFRVGIVWQGNPNHRNDANRSVALDCFLPLADVPGVQLYSLQKFDGRDQLAALPMGHSIHDLGEKLDPGSDQFVDTAAVMACLNLVICVDTAVAHLAGALARPVWLLVPYSPDWRWQLQREDSPWYPTMRLFRQSEFGDWGGVFKRVRRALVSTAA